MAIHRPLVALAKFVVVAPELMDLVVCHFENPSFQIDSVFSTTSVVCFFKKA